MDKLKWIKIATYIFQDNFLINILIEISSKSIIKFKLYYSNFIILFVFVCVFNFYFIFS